MQSYSDFSIDKFHKKRYDFHFLPQTFFFMENIA